MLKFELQDGNFRQSQPSLPALPHPIIAQLSLISLGFSSCGPSGLSVSLSSAFAVSLLHPFEFSSLP